MSMKSLRPMSCSTEGSICTFSFENDGDSDAVQVNITSPSAAHARVSERGLYTMSKSCSSCLMASTLLFSSVYNNILLHPFATKCLITSFLIFPPPKTTSLELVKEHSGSFMSASSTAGELTETDPEEMFVSVLSRFPTEIACLNNPLIFLSNQRLLVLFSQLVLLSKNLSFPKNKRIKPRCHFKQLLSGILVV